MATQTVAPTLIDAMSKNPFGLTTPITLAEYWAIYYHDPDHVYEFNDGILAEKPIVKRHQADILTWFESLLRRYLNANPIAQFSPSGVGFELRLRDKTEVHRPDLGIVLHSNAVPFEANEPDYEGIFDLCVELVSDSSPTEIERNTIAKYNAYAEAGVKEYWLLTHDPKILGFYRLTPQGLYEAVPQNADGVWVSQVLPGFQLRYSDLLIRPPLNTLRDDAVYASFIASENQTERKSTGKLNHRADAPRTGKAEHHQVKKLIAYLRQQGLNPKAVIH